MADSEKKMNKYIKAVKRRLDLPRDIRERVISDFASSVTARFEAGETVEQIISALGSPSKAAAELNAQMKDYTYRKSPWRWICLVLILISILCLLFHGSIGLLAALFNSHSASLGIIGGADGPTSIFISTSADYVFHQMLLYIVTLVMGVVGFWALSHIKRK